MYRKPCTLKIDVPEDVEIEVYLYKISDGKCIFLKPVETKVTEGKQQFTINVPDGISWPAWGNSIFLRAGKNAPENFYINIKITGDTQEILADLSVPIVVLPEVKDLKLPESIGLLTWYSYPLARIDLNRDSGKLPLAMLENWKNTGFCGGDRLPYASGINWQIIRDLTSVFTYYPEVYKAEPGEQKPPFAITAAGVVWERYFCSSAMAEMGEKIYKRNLERFLEKDPSIKDKNVWGVIDYEPYAPIEGWVTKTCFCPVCVKNFASFSNIKDENLDPKTILTKYQNEWVKFRCWQRSQEVLAMSKAFHSINPEGKFLLASMPMPEKTADQQYFKEYGIDLRFYDDFIDIHYPMCYEDGLDFFQRVERSVRELKKEVIPIIGNYNKLMTPSRVGIQTLACGMLGCKRICYWTGLNMTDGAMMIKIKEAMKKLAKIEPYIVKGQIVEDEVNVTGGFGAEGYLYSIVRKLANKYCVLLVNNNPNESCYARISVKQPKKGNYSVVNAIDGLLWSVDGAKKTFTEKELEKGLAVKIEPLSDVLVEIIPKNLSKSAIIKYNTNSISEEERIKQSFYSSKMEWKSHYDMSAGLKKIEGKDFYAIETPAQRLLIDTNDSGVVRWEKKNKDEWIQIGSAICRDVFVYPITMWLTDKKIDLSGVEFTQNAVKISFSYNVREEPFSGLVIKKTYIVEKNNPKISVNITIVQGIGFRPFAYRSHHIVNAGIKTSESKGTPYSNSIEYLIPDSEKIIKDDNFKDFSTMYVRANAIFPDSEPFLKKEVSQIKSFDGNWCALRNKITGEIVKATFDSRVCELFLWRSGSLATLEWIYQSPYLQNDPHLATTWIAEYILEYDKSF